MWVSRTGSSAPQTTIGDRAHATAVHGSPLGFDSCRCANPGASTMPGNFEEQPHLLLSRESTTCEHPGQESSRKHTPAKPVEGEPSETFIAAL